MHFFSQRRSEFRACNHPTMGARRGTAAWAPPAVWMMLVAVIVSSGMRTAHCQTTLGDGSSTERLTTKRDEAKYFTFNLPAVRTTVRTNMKNMRVCVCVSLLLLLLIRSTRVVSVDVCLPPRFENTRGFLSLCLPYREGNVRPCDLPCTQRPMCMYLGVLLPHPPK